VWVRVTSGGRRSPLAAVSGVTLGREVAPVVGAEGLEAEAEFGLVVSYLVVP